MRDKRTPKDVCEEASRIMLRAEFDVLTYSVYFQKETYYESYYMYFPVAVACEQALLLGRVKQVSRERASESLLAGYCCCNFWTAIYKSVVTSELAIYSWLMLKRSHIQMTATSL